MLVCRQLFELNLCVRFFRLAVSCVNARVVSFCLKVGVVGQVTVLSGRALFCHVRNVRVVVCCQLLFMCVCVRISLAHVRINYVVVISVITIVFVCGLHAFLY